MLIGVTSLQLKEGIKLATGETQSSACQQQPLPGESRQAFTVCIKAIFRNWTHFPLERFTPFPRGLHPHTVMEQSQLEIT